MMLLRRIGSAAARAATVNPPLGLGRRRPSTTQLPTGVSVVASRNAGGGADASPTPPRRRADAAKGGAIRCFGDGPTVAASAAGSAPAGAAGGGGFLANLIDRYSIRGQQQRIVLAERLFRTAQRRSTDGDWFAKGNNLHIDRTAFRPQHALLTMHVWFLHRRLLLEQQRNQTQAPTDSNGGGGDGGAGGGVGGSSPSSSSTSNPLLVQEELFETLWHDTRSRIRAAGVQELAVSKNLKDVQNLTFQMCMAFDHAVEMEGGHRRRRDDVGLVLWTHLYLSDDGVPDAVVDAVADYVLAQYDNVCFRLPGEYWAEGRVGWVPIPRVDLDDTAAADSSPGDDNGGEGGESPSLPPGWFPTLTDGGETYYWNEDTMESSWERPPPPPPPPRSPTTVEAAAAAAR